MVPRMHKYFSKKGKQLWSLGSYLQYNEWAVSRSVNHHN